MFRIQFNPINITSVKYKYTNYERISFAFFAILFSVTPKLFAQNAKIKSILFIGNSYTAVNDLPNWVRLIGLSQGDTFDVTGYSPGGRTFFGHSTDPQVMNFFQQKNYDVVVLQEQSQIPSFPKDQVESDCYPYAKELVDSVRANNPFAKIVFYSTWGRQNGDAQNCVTWPPVCTFKGMNQLLRDRYVQMAIDNYTWVAPISSVWRDVRDTTSINLYQGDGSHPSFEGTHLAAMTIYQTIFQKKITQNCFVGPVSTINHNQILNTVEHIVHDSVKRWNHDTCTVPSLFQSKTIRHLNTTESMVQVEALRNDPRADYTWYSAENSTWKTIGIGSKIDSLKITQNGKIVLVAKNACGTDTFMQQFAYNSFKTIEKRTKLGMFLVPGQVVTIKHTKAINSIKFYDLQGKVVENIEPNEDANEIKLLTPYLKPGFYILQINGAQIQRVLIGH